MGITPEQLLESKIRVPPTKIEKKKEGNFKNRKKVKEKIKVRLSELNGIAPQKYSAMELHSQRGHLLERVQRQENRRYYKNVDLRKKKLNEDLAKIQTYYDALAVEVERRALPLEEPTL